jgi:hypothetical protein
VHLEDKKIDKEVDMQMNARKIDRELPNATELSEVRFGVSALETSGSVTRRVVTEPHKKHATSPLQSPNC